MVRLDDATKAYAETLGKGVNELTQYERRMAFTNAIIDQGVTKFGLIADSVDVNPYDKLAASFTNLATSFLNVVNTVLSPMISLLANNTGALVGALVLFGTTVTQQMVPSLFKAAEGAAKARDELADLADSQLSNLKINSKMSATFKSLAEDIVDGSASIPKMEKGLAELVKTQTRHEALLDRTKAKHGVDSKQYKDKVKLLSEVTQAQKILTAAIVTDYQAQAKNLESDALAFASKLKMRDALQYGVMAYQANAKAAQAAAMQSSMLGKVWVSLRTTAYGASVAVKILGTAFLTVLPYIGLIIAAVGLLYEGFQKLFGKSDLQKKADEVSESFGSIATISNQLTDAINRTSNETEIYLLRLNAFVGVMDQLKSGIIAIQQAQQEGAQKRYVEATKELIEVRKTLNDLAAKDLLNSVNGFIAKKKEASLLEEMLVYQEEATSLSKEHALATLQVVLEQTKQADNITKGRDREISQLEEYKNTLSKLPKGARVLNAEVNGAIERITSASKGASEALKGLLDASKNIDKEFKELGKDEQGPYEKLMGSVVSLQELYKTTVNDSTDSAKTFIEELKKADGIVLNLLMGFNKGLDLTNIKAVEIAIGDLSADLASMNEKIYLAKVAAKQADLDAKDLSKKKDYDPVVVQKYYNAVNAGRTAELASLKSQRDLWEAEEAGALRREADSNKHAKIKEGYANRLRSINLQILGVTSQMVPQEEILLEQLKAQAAKTALIADLNKQAYDIKSKLVESELKLLELTAARSRMLVSMQKMQANPYSSGDLNPIEELEQFQQLKEARFNAALQEQAIKLQMIDVEFALLDAKLVVAEAEAKLKGVDISRETATIRELNKQLKAKQVILATDETANKILGDNVEEQTRINAAAKYAKELAIEQLEVNKSVTAELQKRLDISKQLNEQSMGLATDKAKETNLQTRGTTEVDPWQELEIFNQYKAERLSLIEQEASLKATMIEIEYGLLDAQWELLIAQLKEKGMKVSGYENLKASLGEAKNSALSLLQVEKERALSALNTEGLEKQNAAYQTIFDSLTGMSGILDGVDLATLGSSLNTFADSMVALTNGAVNNAEQNASILASLKTELEEIDKQIAATQKMKNRPSDKYVEKLYQQRAAIKKKTDVVEAKSEKDKWQSLNSFAQAGASVAIGLMQSVASAQDTSTKEGFEKSKDMQLGIAAVSTAAAIMQALASSPPPASYAMAAVAAATGLAQIAAINSTEFGGDAKVSSVGASGGSPNNGTYSDGTGTVLGDKTAQSESVKNSYELLESIHADEYRELRGMHAQLKKLNNSFTGLMGALLKTTDFSGSNLPSGKVGSAEALFAKAADGVDKINNLISDTIGKIPAIGGALKAVWDISFGLAGKLLGGLMKGISKVASSIFGGKTSYKLLESGIDIAKISIEQLQKGVQMGIREYSYIQKKTSGGAFSSTKRRYYYEYKAVSSDVTNLFTNIFRGLGQQILNLTDILGGDIEKALNYVFNIGKINLKGLKSDEIAKKLESVISAAGDKAVGAIMGDIVRPYQLATEGLLETANRLAIGLVVVGDVLKFTGHQMEGDVIAISQNLIDLADGLENFIDKVSKFFDLFFTDRQKFDKASENLKGIFEDIEYAINAEALELREKLSEQGFDIKGDLATASQGLIDRINLSNKARQDRIDQLIAKGYSINGNLATKTVTEIQKVTTWWGSYEKSVQKVLTEKIKPLMEIPGDIILDSMREFELPDTREGYKLLMESLDINTEEGQYLYSELLDLAEMADQYYAYLEEVASQRLDLEIESLRLSGKYMEALVLERVRELEALDYTLHALQEQVWALELLNEHIDLEIELMGVLGFKLAATTLERERELQAMDSSLHSLKRAIWAVTDAEDALKASFKKYMDDLKESYKSPQENINNLKNAISALANATKGSEEITRASILRTIMDVRNLTAEVKEGTYSGLDDLGDYIKTLTTDNSQLYSSLYEYQRDSLRGQIALKELEATVGTQLTTEEKMLEALEAQVKFYEDQLNALLGIDNSVLSIADAISNYQTAKTDAALLLLSGAAVDMSQGLTDSIDKLINLEWPTFIQAPSISTEDNREVPTVISTVQADTTAIEYVKAELSSLFSKYLEIVKISADNQFHLVSQTNTLLSTILFHVQNIKSATVIGQNAVVNVDTSLIIESLEKQYIEQINLLEKLTQFYNEIKTLLELNSITEINNLISVGSSLSNAISQTLTSSNIEMIEATTSLQGDLVSMLETQYIGTQDLSTKQLNTLTSILEGFPKALADAQTLLASAIDKSLAGLTIDIKGTIITVGNELLKQLTLQYNLIVKLYNLELVNSNDEDTKTSFITSPTSQYSSPILTPLSGIFTKGFDSLRKQLGTLSAVIDFEKPLSVTSVPSNPAEDYQTAFTLATSGLLGELSSKFVGTIETAMLSVVESLKDPTTPAPEPEYKTPGEVHTSTIINNTTLNTAELEYELQQLRADLKASQYQIAKNTGDMASTISRWDGDGMPEERDIAI
jgi:hypothetical protein